jgi:maltoporin
MIDLQNSTLNEKPMRLVSLIGEAFVQAGNILKSQRDAKFWAGQRYYRRYQSHINDFYISDMSGYGAGVEDINVKVGRMSLAYLAGARPGMVRPCICLRDVRFVARPGSQYRCLPADTWQCGA